MDNRTKQMNCDEAEVVNNAESGTSSLFLVCKVVYKYW